MKTPSHLVALPALFALTAGALVGCSSNKAEDPIEVVDQGEVEISQSGETSVEDYAVIDLKEDTVVYDGIDGAELGKLPAGEYLVVDEEPGWYMIAQLGSDQTTVVEIGWVPVPVAE